LQPFLVFIIFPYNVMVKRLLTILWAMLILASATKSVWAQTPTSHTLYNIPAGWTVTAGGIPVLVTNGEAIIPEGAVVILTPPDLEKPIVDDIVLMDSILYLPDVTTDTTVRNGWVISGELNVISHPVKISIADGATVMFNGITVNGVNQEYFPYAGITCLGDATIILAEGTTNNVRGFNRNYPGIYVPQGKTLTIQGKGTLNASCNRSSTQSTGAGIGAGYQMNCGNIVIRSGTVNAVGGIASGAGIGGAYQASTGNIAISNRVTSVSAKGGPRVIGAGYESTCGTVTFGTVQMYDGDIWTIEPINGHTYGGLTLAISGNEWTLTPRSYNPPEGAINGLFSVSTDKQVFFSRGNLQWSGDHKWRFALNQYDYIGDAVNNTTPYASNSNYMDLLTWGATGINGLLPNYSATISLTGTSDLSGVNDWGSNAITNGGNTQNSGWRTPSISEWKYLLEDRNSTYKYARGTINGVNGLIVFPDYFEPEDIGLTITNANEKNASFVDYSAYWAAMEDAGCVFLPAAGYRNQTTVESIESYYHSSTHNESLYEWAIFFNGSTTGWNNIGFSRDRGASVRLVHDAE